MAVVQDLSLSLKAKLFRGLADPSRLSILEALRSGEKTVSQIVTTTGLSQPNASKHLTCLRDCGLVDSRPEGNFAYYFILDSRMDDLFRNAEQILAGVAARVYECTRYGGQE